MNSTTEPYRRSKPPTSDITKDDRRALFALKITDDIQILKAVKGNGCHVHSRVYKNGFVCFFSWERLLFGIHITISLRFCIRIRNLSLPMSVHKVVLFIRDRPVAMSHMMSC
jgi:hypothetical protein